MAHRHAFFLQAAISLLFLAGAVAPTPLYTHYQELWHFSSITVTVVFGVYAIAVLAALLVFGALSDHLGRRPLLLAAMLVQAGAMAMFTVADGVPALIAARVVQGLATGVAIAAVGAGLLDLDAQRGPIANAISPPLGTAIGAMLAGLMVQWLPAPTVTVYAVLGVAYLALAVGVWRMPETAARRPGALASLRPRLALPERTRVPLLAATPAVIAAWALAGFYASIGPMLVKVLTGSSAPALGGAMLGVMAAGGATMILSTRHRAPHEVMVMGTLALALGVGVSLASLAHAAIAPFFAGVLVAGAGFGGAFQGAIRMVAPRAEAHERAGVLAIVFVIAYLSMGLPAMLAGVRIVHGGGVVGTAWEYGLTIIVLALVALAGTLALRRRPISAETGRAAT